MRNSGCLFLICACGDAICQRHANRHSTIDLWVLIANANQALGSDCRLFVLTNLRLCFDIKKWPTGKDIVARNATEVTTMTGAEWIASDATIRCLSHYFLMFSRGIRSEKLSRHCSPKDDLYVTHVHRFIA